MAGLLGKVDAFDPELEDWPQYVERLEHFSKPMGSSATRTRPNDGQRSYL